MAENIQKTQNAQLYFSHNSSQMVFLVHKNCKRLRGFLHKKSIFIWFISIFVLILHPEKEIDFQKRTNHNYIKNTNCWNIQKLQRPRRDVGAFGFLLIQKRFLLYATLICGISKTELTTVMEPEVEALGKTLGVSYEECLEELRQYYDGYHFSEHSEDVFYDSTQRTISDRIIKEGW